MFADFFLNGAWIYAPTFAYFLLVCFGSLVIELITVAFFCHRIKLERNSVLILLLGVVIANFVSFAFCGLMFFNMEFSW